MPTCGASQTIRKTSSSQAGRRCAEAFLPMSYCGRNQVNGEISLIDWDKSRGQQEYLANEEEGV